jgi:hypothetical protein
MDAIPGIHPSGALRASRFVPVKTVDSHHPLQFSNPTTTPWYTKPYGAMYAITPLIQD